GLWRDLAEAAARRRWAGPPCTRARALRLALRASRAPSRDGDPCDPHSARVAHSLALVRVHVREKRARMAASADDIARSRAVIESPPKRSSRASARTKATIASPTTAAAGTAQTSLRSMAAGASVIVDRSTERSGFISVEIGFMYAMTRTSSPLVTPPSRPPALLVGRATPTGRSPRMFRRGAGRI